MKPTETDTLKKLVEAQKSLGNCKNKLEEG
jgi:hypothetical protein